MMRYVAPGFTSNDFIHRFKVLHHLQCFFFQLVALLSRDFLKEGWLSKKGPRQSDAYRRRWCSLDKRKLMYFEDPLVCFARFTIA